MEKKGNLFHDEERFSRSLRQEGTTNNYVNA
jgi:hypothetical protein